MEPTNEIIIAKIPEILENLFSHFNVKSLSRATAVNRLWKEMATRELRKRGPQIIIMPVSNLYNCVQTKPVVTFFFVSSSHRRDTDVETYKNAFPNHSIIVTAGAIMIDENEIVYRDFESKHGLVSLLLPEYRDLKIRTAYDKNSYDRTWYKDSNNYIDPLAQKFFNDFLPEDSKSKVTFILFGNELYNSGDFLKSLQNRMRERQQDYSIWGADYNKAPFEASDPLYRYDSDSQGIFAMSITGSSLESWSIEISCYNIKKHDFDQKLLDFKDAVRFKRRSIGLLCAPRLYKPYTYNSPEELTKTVKRIFPHVPLIGLHDCFRCFGSMSKTNDTKQRIVQIESLALMILTFD